MRHTRIMAVIIAAATVASALEVKLEQDAQSQPIGENMWKCIEYAKDLWGNRLGFANSYPNDTVTVYLKMNKAEDAPADAFMYTNNLRETFSGSRRIANGASTTITFKDRAYVYKGATYQWNEDAPWFAPADPSQSYFWGTCNVFERVCNATAAPGRQFCFISHIGHEFGHVFGFVGNLLVFGQTAGSPGGFAGVNSDGAPFAFDYSGNTSHAKTTMMSLGFSVWQRAYPCQRELDACRVAFGFAGTTLLDHGSLTVAKGAVVSASFEVTESFDVGTVEYTSSYAASGAVTEGSVAVRLIGPDGTEASLGTLRPGWAKEGYARPELTSNRASFNPPDTLAVFRGKTARGTWTARYVNSGNGSVTIPGCALRLTTAGASAVAPATPPASKHSLAPRSALRHLALVDLRGRTVRRNGASSARPARAGFAPTVAVGVADDGVTATERFVVFGHQAGN